MNYHTMEVILERLLARIRSEITVLRLFILLPDTTDRWRSAALNYQNAQTSIPNGSLTF